jgi:hypothetical protein
MSFSYIAEAELQLTQQYKVQLCNSLQWARIPVWTQTKTPIAWGEHCPGTEINCSGGAFTFCECRRTPSRSKISSVCTGTAHSTINFADWLGIHLKCIYSKPPLVAYISTHTHISKTAQCVPSSCTYYTLLYFRMNVPCPRVSDF